MGKILRETAKCVHENYGTNKTAGQEFIYESDHLKVGDVSSILRKSFLNYKI